MKKVDRSQLIIGGVPQGYPVTDLVEKFSARGISRDRLSFFGRCGMNLYLSQLHKVDLCLDTFPYNGGTTTLHSAWMGVPTITISGKTVASRTGASVLSHLKLDRMVTTSTEGFINECVYWSEHWTELAAIRQQLRQRMVDSAILKPELLADSIGDALKIMWARWCADEPAISFDVEADV